MFCMTLYLFISSSSETEPVIKKKKLLNKLYGTVLNIDMAFMIYFCLDTIEKNYI